ncbi:response regulator [Mucilaginibacter pedocola]|uniref:Response regulatory domain-containing protein n=1 Tax=Mucilaginibacter pedocola TaxID=1792845 RepID=A0A1S9P6W8_9SPHI|nr:response regulator [Mucilaginibacter pedocola]OOQ56702.1 hypothetical protein BC343_17040 [Mucilaginibacter pedocola]
MTPLISTKKYRILVVEDNPGDFALVEDFLCSQPDEFELTHAKTYKQVRAALNDPQKCFDAILLDLSLPDMQGMALISEISTLDLPIPVIVLTGYSDMSFGVRSLSMGISDYLLKDELDPTNLYKSIVYSVERKRSVSALATSQKKYSELFHLSPLPMLVFDQETSQILDANKAALKQYRYTHSELLAMHIEELYATGDTAPREMEPEKGKTSLQQQGIYQHRCKDGKLIKVDILSNNIEFKSRPAMVILANDVTERLDYIKAIEAQNDKLAEISWMQSHLVRAPVARLLALTQLFSASKDASEKEEMAEYILKSAQELDEVIKHITISTGIVINDNLKKSEMLSKTTN